MIIKIQRPLETNAPADDEIALIYNQSRSYEAHVPLSEVAHLFKNNEAKIYHKAKLSANAGIKPTADEYAVGLSLQTGKASTMKRTEKGLMIGRRMEDQPW